MRTKDTCEHQFIILREAGPKTGEGQGGEMYPAVMKCHQCNLIMTASEALQLTTVKNQTEQLKHLKTFEKRVAIITIVVSASALIISLIALLTKKS